MSVGSQIGNAFKSEHGIGALYIGIIAAALGEILPDPSDALYFYLDRKWRVKLEEGQITPEEYWKKKTSAYYFLDFFWWLIILLIAVLVKGDIKKKALVVGAVVGGGAVLGIIFQNIRKDEEFFAKYKFVER